MRSTVAIHFTESGVWSWSHLGEWAGSPVLSSGVDSSVSVTASDDSCRFLSPISFIDDEFLDIGGAVVRVADALAAIVDVAIEGVAASASIDTIVMSHPTEWGTARKDALSAACFRRAPDVLLVPVAIVAAHVVAGAEGVARDAVSRRVVLEGSEFGVTASCVEYVAGECHVVHCERDRLPAHAQTDDDSDSPKAIADLAWRAARARGVGEVIVAGGLETQGFDAIRNALVAAFVSNVEIRRVSPGDLVRALEISQRPSIEDPVIAVGSSANWLESSLEQANQRGSISRWPTVVTVAVAATLVFGVFLVLGLRRPVESQQVPQVLDTSIESPVSTASHPYSSTLATTTSSNFANDQITVGEIRLLPPIGWHERPLQRSGSSPSMRIELVPGEGAGRRIIVTQNTVDAGSGYHEVAETLSARIAERGRPDLFGDLERDVDFGGRLGISYNEYPGENSQVRWHVLVERDLQVSVGCQFLVGEWTAIEAECQQTVRSLVVQ